MRQTLAALSLTALTACGIGHAAAPRIEISRPPSGIRVGEAWNVVVTVRGARPRAFVIARSGVERTFRLMRSGRVFRARVAFPARGRWRYGVRLGARTVFAGTVDVRGRRPIIEQPFGVVEEASGTILVADSRAGIVYRLDPRRREGTIVARIPAPRDLIRAPDGRLLVASGNRILALDAATGASMLVAEAQAFVGGIAADVDGTLYVNEEGTRVVRLAPDGGREVLASGLDGVHGLLLTPEGLVVCESFAGRVLRMQGTRVDVLAGGLGNPSYAARAPDGTLYVSEFLAGRISRLAAAGAVEEVASVARPGPVSLDRRGRILVGTLDGSIYRVDPVARSAARIYP